MEKQHTYAKCPDCEQEMKPGGGCTFTHFKLADGRMVLRNTERFGTGDCHDCNAAVGKPHHFGCDNERCPVCGGQAIGCECLKGAELVRVEIVKGAKL